MTHKILILPGDGIGPEIIAEAAKVLECLRQECGLDAALEYGLLGGCAVDELGEPYPEVTRRQAREADAILLGAVGGPQWEAIDRPLRPERGLLAIRADLQLFANLRPALLYSQLASASALKSEIVAGLDLLIVRELNGGIYFGQPTLPSSLSCSRFTASSENSIGSFSRTFSAKPCTNIEIACSLSMPRDCR